MSDQSLPVEPARRGVAYARPWSLVAGLVLVALVFGLVLLRGQEPAPLPVDAPASEFSAGRAMALLGELLAEGQPHPVGSEMNARVRERIVGHLGALGYEVEVQETVVCRGWTGTLRAASPGAGCRNWPGCRMPFCTNPGAGPRHGGFWAIATPNPPSIWRRPRAKPARVCGRRARPLASPKRQASLSGVPSVSRATVSRRRHRPSFPCPSDRLTQTGRRSYYTIIQ